MPFHVQSSDGVHPLVLPRLRKLCEGANELLDVDHHVDIFCDPVEQFTTDIKGKPFECAGLFDCTGNQPNIFVATGSINLEFCLRYIEGILAHELAHYEQWRDGRELIERGVAVRARNILRLIRDRWHEG
jgi:hypothetical protein